MVIPDYWSDKEKWTDAQRAVYRYWASQPKSPREKIVTREARQRGKNRRRIELKADSKRVGEEIREVWEED